MNTLAIIILIIFMLNIVFDIIDLFMFKKAQKDLDEQIDSLLFIIDEYTKKVDSIEKAKDEFENTTEKISKEHRMLVNEVNKTNEAITIMNNGFTVASSKTF